MEIFKLLKIYYFPKIKENKILKMIRCFYLNPKLYSYEIIQIYTFYIYIIKSIILYIFSIFSI